MKSQQRHQRAGRLQDVLAHGGGPCRRFYDKDALRLGTWFVGPRRWTVTPATLRRLVINFQRARARGIRIPVVWNHSRDVRDKLGEVVRLYVAGPVLRARFWAAGDANVIQLENAAHEVSVEVVEGWVDGQGRHYDLFLTHLAIVNHPVVGRQGPLVRLSLTTLDSRLRGNDGLQRCHAGGYCRWSRHPDSCLRGNHGLQTASGTLGRRNGNLLPLPSGEGRGEGVFVGCLAPTHHGGWRSSGEGRGEGVFVGLPTKLSANDSERLQTSLDKGAVRMTQAASPETQVDPGTAEPSEIVEAINQIVASLGVSLALAKDTTLGTLADRLRELRDQIDALVGADLDPSLVAASLEESTVDELRDRLAQTTRQLALERRRSQEERATQFEAALNRLIGEGKLTVADKPALLETGRSVNYALSLLAPFDRIARGAAVPIQSQSKRFGTARPAALGRPSLDEERIREITRDYRG